MKIKELLVSAQNTADAKAQIVTGSYVGVGGSGENKANYLDFSNSVPNMLFIVPITTADVTGSMEIGIINTVGLTGEKPSGISIEGFSTIGYSDPIVGTALVVVVRNNRLYWYVNSSATDEYGQLNVSGKQYNYLGIY